MQRLASTGPSMPIIHCNKHPNRAYTVLGLGFRVWCPEAQCTVKLSYQAAGLEKVPFRSEALNSQTLIRRASIMRHAVIYVNGCVCVCAFICLHDLR